MLQPEVIPYNENEEARKIREDQEEGWTWFSLIVFILGSLVFLFTTFAFFYKWAGWKLQQHDHKLNDMGTLMIEYMALWALGVVQMFMAPICYTWPPHPGTCIYAIWGLCLALISFQCIIQIDYEFYILCTDKGERDHYTEVAGSLFLHASFIFGGWFAFWTVMVLICCPCIMCYLQVHYMNANYAGPPDQNDPLLGEYEWPPHDG